MNEVLKIRLGEYLLSRGVKFEEVNGFDLDSDSVTLDIWYRNGADHGYHEMSGNEIVEFATFLATGGK